jgi:CheY-like chemotaxis protein
MTACTSSPPQLLIVEDDQAQRELLQTLLAELGYRCLTASSLEQALRLVNLLPVDLIVSDCFSSTFLEALPSLRPLRELASPAPVIICTAWPLADIEVTEQGFAGLVPKPLTFDHLVTTVTACLNQPFSEEQLRQAEVAQRYVAAMSRWDIDALVALLAEDIQYYPWLVPAYPAAHPWMGRAAGRTYYQEMARYFGVNQMEVVQVYPVPNGVATRVLSEWYDPNGICRQHMLCFFFQFTDAGQIRQIGMPPRDEQMRALLEPLEPPPGW